MKFTSQEKRKIREPFTLRYTLSRYRLAQEVAKDLPGNPDPRSGDFFWKLLEIAGAGLENRQKAKGQIVKLIGQWNIKKEEIELFLN